MKKNNFIPENFAKSLLGKISHVSFMPREIWRSDFIEEVKEYHSLSNRRWKRKRDLEKLIAGHAKYWLKDIEEIQKKKSIIRGPRISKVPKL